MAYYYIYLCVEGGKYEKKPIRKAPSLLEKSLYSTTQVTLLLCSPHTLPSALESWRWTLRFFTRSSQSASKDFNAPSSHQNSYIIIENKNLLLKQSTYLSTFLSCGFEVWHRIYVLGQYALRICCLLHYENKLTKNIRPTDI